MLKKLGWSEGKGLGLREQGRTEPVTVRMKRDNSGVGAGALSALPSDQCVLPSLAGSSPGLQLSGQWQPDAAALDEVFRRIRKGRRKADKASRSKLKRAAKDLELSGASAKRATTDR
jgi:hypothetical protein